MPYRAPDNNTLIVSLNNLNSSYTTDATRRLQSLCLIKTIKQLTPQSKPLVGVVIFVMEEIYNEYNYLHPTRSQLYNALQAALGISAQNSLSVNDKVTYLFELWQVLDSERDIQFNGLAYFTIEALRSDIKKCMVGLLQQSHPTLFAANEPATNTFVSYIPGMWLASSMLSVFSLSTKPVEEVISSACRDAILGLPDDDVTRGIKNKLRSMKETYAFAENNNLTYTPT